MILRRFGRSNWKRNASSAAANWGQREWKTIMEVMMSGYLISIERMRMRYTSIMLAALVAVSSCTHKEAVLSEESQPRYYTFSAITEDDGRKRSEEGTKTYLDDNERTGKDIKWYSDESITVFSDHSSLLTYELTSGAKTTKATFQTKEKPDFGKDEAYYAFYPAHMVTDEGGQRKYSWPSSLTRTMYEPENVWVPMYATGGIEDGALDDGKFNCLGGILNLLIMIPEDGNPGYIHKITVEADQKISGLFTLAAVSSAEEEDSDKKYAVIDQSEGSNKITVTLNGNGGQGPYFRPGETHQCMLPVPVSPADGYTNLAINFYDQYNNRISGVKSAKPVIIERKKITTARIPFSHVYAPELSMSSPVGTIGKLYGIDAMVVELRGMKRAIALENLGATKEHPEGKKYSSKNFEMPLSKSHFNLQNGWRLPSIGELMELSSIFSYKFLKLSTDDGSGGSKVVYQWKVTDTASLTFDFGGDSGILITDENKPDPEHLDYFQYLATFDNRDYNGTNYLISSFTWDRDIDFFVRPMRSLPQFPISDPEKELTANDPVGTLGILNGREAIRIDLYGKKMAIATMSVGASTYDDSGSYFQFNEGEDQAWDFGKIGLEDGWRLPTSHELMGLRDYLHHAISNIRGDDRVFGLVFDDQTRLSLPCDVTPFLTSERDMGVRPGDYPEFYDPYSGRGFYVRPVYCFDPPITKDSPEGYRGYLDGREGIVVKVGDQKLVMAMKNTSMMQEDYRVNSYSYKQYWTLGELITGEHALARVNNSYYGHGWRLPTEVELAGVVSGYLTNVEGTSGEPGYAMYGYAGGWCIELPYVGYAELEKTRKDKCSGGYYMTSSVNGDNMRILHMKGGTDYEFFGRSKQWDGYSVRLFHDMPN